MFFCNFLKISFLALKYKVIPRNVFQVVVGGEKPPEKSCADSQPVRVKFTSTEEIHLCSSILNVELKLCRVSRSIKFIIFKKKVRRSVLGARVKQENEWTWILTFRCLMLFSYAFILLTHLLAQWRRKVIRWDSIEAATTPSLLTLVRLFLYELMRWQNRVRIFKFSHHPGVLLLWRGNNSRSLSESVWICSLKIEIFHSSNSLKIELVSPTPLAFRAAHIFLQDICENKKSLMFYFRIVIIISSRRRAPTEERQQWRNKEIAE